MKIGRRTFGKLAGAGLAALCLGGSIFTSGCGLTPANAKALLNILINSIQKILNVATGAPWAAQLVAALAALQMAAASWTSGGPVAIVDDALNTVEAVLAVIPLTALYSPLVDLVVSGIEAVLAVLPITPAVTRLRAKLATNPHHGRVLLDKTSLIHPTPEGAFKAQWNHSCKEIGLPQSEQ